MSLLLLLFFLLPSFLYAKIYQIPDDLKKEVEENFTRYKQNPDFLDARFELAMSYGYTGQILKGWTMLKTFPPTYSVEVIKKYEPLTAAENTEWKSHFKLAFGYYFAEKKADAKEQFLKVLELDPGHVWAMGFIALIEGAEGHTDEGIAWCKKALAIEPNATAIHFLIAEGYRRKKEYFAAFGHMLIVGRLATEEGITPPNEKTP